MSDSGCPRGHVWVTYSNAKVSVCKNCGADRAVEPLPYNDPLMVAERERAKAKQDERTAKLEAALHKINALIDSPSRFNADVQAVLDSVIDTSDVKFETQN